MHIQSVNYYFFLQIFTVSTTDIGFCCSFNMIPPLESLSDVG